MAKKKKRKLLTEEWEFVVHKRRTWTMDPVTRVKPSKKKYSRKDKSWKKGV